MSAETSYQGRPQPHVWAVAAAILLYHLLHLMLLLALAAGAGTFLYLLMTNGILTHLPGLPGIAVVWWVTWQAFAARVPRIDERELINVARLPRLAAAIEDAAHRVDAPPPKAVRLTTDATIGATEDGGFLAGLVGGRRVLVLGVAALPFLSEEEFRCLLAGALARWTQHQTWYGRQARRMEFASESVRELFGPRVIRWLNPVFWLFGGFSAVFGRLLANYLKERGLWTDQLVVQAYSRADTASALKKQSLYAVFCSDPNHFGTKLQFGHRSVTECWSLVEAAAEECPEWTWDELWDWALEDGGRPLDPHPWLGDRLEALDASLEMPAVAQKPLRPATDLFQS